VGRGVVDVTPVRILIADDHEVVRQGVRTILQSEPGWVVCGEAATGRQALAMAIELKPDLIVLDLGLPEMNGVEVTRQVRRVMTAPILIVTVHEGDQMVQDAFAAGANGYVLKADAGRTLKDATRAVLSHGHFISDRVQARAGVESPDHQTPMGRRRLGRLTSREREVLTLLAGGLANKEVASALGITTKTAETHRARIMGKLDAHSVSALVRYAIRNGLINP
jgi:DNA-binding NarL/FixJ family response regulator